MAEKKCRCWRPWDHQKDCPEYAPEPRRERRPLDIDAYYAAEHDDPSDPYRDWVDMGGEG